MLRSRSLSVYNIQTSFATSRDTMSRRLMSCIFTWNTAAVVILAHISSAYSAIIRMPTRCVIPFITTLHLRI
jgi:hypothetical protein